MAFHDRIRPRPSLGRTRIAMRPIRAPPAAQLRHARHGSRQNRAWAA
jgi:hypothetical protein